MKRLRIAFAEDEPDMWMYLSRTLPLIGHEVVCAAKDGKELVEGCRTSKPDLLITDVRMPELDGIDAALQVFREKPLPIILLTAFTDAEQIQRAESSHVLAYLVKPIKESDLGPAIAMANRRFEQFLELQQEAADLKQALDDRKIIERAKGIMMKRAKVDEPEAFRRLQKLATSKRQKLVDVAKLILSVEEVYDMEALGG